MWFLNVLYQIVQFGHCLFMVFKKTFKELGYLSSSWHILDIQQVVVDSFPKEKNVECKYITTLNI